MKKINESKYSREKFDGYKLRVVVDVIDKRRENLTLHLYTTQTDKNNILNDLKKTIKVDDDGIKIVHTATEEQDIAASKFVDEILLNPQVEAKEGA